VWRAQQSRGRDREDWRRDVGSWGGVVDREPIRGGALRLFPPSTGCPKQWKKPPPRAHSAPPGGPIPCEFLRPVGRGCQAAVLVRAMERIAMEPQPADDSLPRPGNLAGNQASFRSWSSATRIALFSLVRHYTAQPSTRSRTWSRRPSSRPSAASTSFQHQSSFYTWIYRIAVEHDPRLPEAPRPLAGHRGGGPGAGTTAASRSPSSRVLSPDARIQTRGDRAITPRSSRACPRSSAPCS
jgi:hypothetical protein